MMGNKNKKVLLYRNLNAPVSGHSRSLPSTRRNQKAVVRQKPVKRWLLTGLCFLFIIGGIRVHYMNQAHAEAIAAAAERARVTAAKQAEYKTSVQAVIDAHPETDISVVAIDLNGGPTTELGSSDIYTAASTAKVLSAVTYLHYVETGALSLNAKQAEDLRKMVQLSDNDSWQRINDAITHARLRTYAKQLGMVDYNPTNNTMTAHDMGVLMRQLYSGSILSESHRTAVLQYMKDANYRDIIVANVPQADFMTYHKIGFTDGNIHDVAYITHNGAEMALLIYTNGSGTYDSTKRQDIFQPIVAAAIKAYL